MTTRTRSADNHQERPARHSRLALIALACALAAAALATAACSQAAPTASESTAPSTSQSAPTSGAATEASPSEAPPATPEVTKLQIKDTKKGTGPAAKVGDTVTVDYTGWLLDGTKFDSSLDAGQPFSFTIGQQKVIEGWEKGLVGMKVGGTRVLIIPSQMAYGEQGSPPVIPANAPLKFEITLHKIAQGQ